ncbi:hypothetical protein Tco_0403826 [Tanacetum coccineum]
MSIPSPNTPTSAPPTSQPPISSTSRRLTRQESVVPQPRSPTQTNVADEAASTGVDVRLGGATTTVTGLEAGQGSGNIDKTPTTPYDSPLPRVNNLERDKRVVKKLEKTIKTNQARRKARLVVSDDEEDLEDPSKQGRKIVEIDQDPDISLVQHDAKVQGRHEHDMESDFEFNCLPEKISTASASLAKDKGKAIIEEAETIQTKTKLQQEQERLGYEAALRLQEQLDAEERQRIARVHEAASSFNIEEWEDIQARIEADEELAQRLQAEEREKYSEAEKERLLAELINQRKRHFTQQRAKERRNKPPTQAQYENSLFEATMKRVNTFTPMKSDVDKTIPKIAVGSSKRDAEEELCQENSKRQKIGESSQQAKEPRDKESNELSQEELQQLMIIVLEEGMNIEALQTKYPIIDWEVYIKVNYESLVPEGFNSTEPTEDKEIEIWVELKRLFEPDADDEIWKSQKHIHDVTWRLYDTCGVHHVSIKDGIDIYMLVEREYHLLKEQEDEVFWKNPSQKPRFNQET